MKVDFLIVGSGLFGSVFAQQCKQYGKTCVVIEKNEHIAGNCHTEKIEGIDVHKFGPHCFHTNSWEIHQYAQRFAKFNQYVHRVKARHKDKLYTLPFNLSTMNEVYGVSTPAEAKQKLEEVRVKIEHPRNLEEHCLASIGPDLYELLIKHYTAKQWMRDPKDLPASIIKRLPIRMTFDDRYQESNYSGIPENGYTAWISNMLDGVKVQLGIDFIVLKKLWRKYAHRLVYSGKIDALFDYCYGDLEYRTLRFDTKVLDGDFQGNSQINYTSNDVPFTRITEHKHFTFKNCDKTVVSWEYPVEYSRDKTPYYPVADEKNEGLHKQYKKLAAEEKDILIGGRLGNFIYRDMAPTIAEAIKKFREAIS